MGVAAAWLEPPHAGAAFDRVGRRAALDPEPGRNDGYDLKDLWREHRAQGASQADTRRLIRIAAENGTLIEAQQVARETGPPLGAVDAVAADQNLRRNGFDPKGANYRV